MNCSSVSREVGTLISIVKGGGGCCEILKYSQVYEPYRSIVGQERGQTHRDLNERRKIKSILTKLILI